MEDLKLGDLLAYGTLSITFIAVCLAIYAFIKEIQIGKYKSKLENINAKLEMKIREIEYSSEIDEICYAYLEEHAELRVRQMQRLKVALNRLVQSDEQKIVVESLIYVCEVANPLKQDSYFKTKKILQSLWFDEKFHELGIDSKIVVEFRGTFGEDILPLCLAKRGSRVI